MLIALVVPTVKMMQGEINMLLLGMIAVIAILLYINEQGTETSQSREDLKLAKEFYLKKRGWYGQL